MSRPVVRQHQVQSTWTHVLRPQSLATPCGIDTEYLQVRLAADDAVPTCRRCRLFSGKALP